MWISALVALSVGISPADRPDRSPHAGLASCGCGDVGCCPQAEVDLRFTRTFTGSYRSGEPLDVITVDPDGTGDTLEDAGIRLRVRLTCECGGGPIAGIPATEIVLYAPSVCTCDLWTASAPTDADGWTEFHGTLRGGGCASSMVLIVDGVMLASVPLRTNSADTVAATPCSVDAGDIPAFAQRLGRPADYAICSDLNEDGIIDAGDLAGFAAALGGRCP